MAKEPAELSKLREEMWDGTDNLLKKGEIKEFGFFLDETSEYATDEKDLEITFKNKGMFLPYYVSSVHEIIPYEKAKKSWRLSGKLKQRCRTRKVNASCHPQTWPVKKTRLSFSKTTLVASFQHRNKPSTSRLDEKRNFKTEETRACAFLRSSLWFIFNVF
jgi:hypothetical protein